jgi:hypothetical protein
MREIYPWSGRLQSTVDDDLLIGRRDRDFARNLAGSIADFRIYSRALDSSEIEDLYRGASTVPGLVGHWRLQGAAGTLEPDLSGNGNHAVLSAVTSSERGGKKAGRA